MSTRITYASLQHNTWVYRRTYPRHLQPLLGSSLKQSLKTTDARVAKARVEELNATFAKVVSEAEASLTDEKKNGVLHPQTTSSTSTPATTPDTHTVQLKVTRPRYARVLLRGDKTVAEMAKAYLEEQCQRLRPGSYKSVRFAMELLTSHLGTTSLNALTLAQGREVLSLISRLSPNIRKYRVAWGQPLTQLARLSGELESQTLTAKTQGRIWEQMTGFLTWAVQQGELSANPWERLTLLATERSETKPHAVLTDEQVGLLLQTVSRQSQVYGALLFGLLAGLRSGEICGLTWGDIRSKGNLGRFVCVRPNQHRPLKSKAAEREVPLHPTLEAYLDRRSPASSLSTTDTPEDRLFPRLTVDRVVKAYAKLRTQHPTLQGTVFHSTRKWFVTQCERTGTPEHFTATLVGHASARSANRLTYGLYSGGISDEQKRRIIDGVRLPVPTGAEE
ncbi:tyrosine-type recombinase/integrase [Paradonghicola geojensis]|nr:tyrosine-type recombinase/integrase [Marivivens geojensis]